MIWPTRSRTSRVRTGGSKKPKALPVIEFVDKGTISDKKWLVQHLLVRGESSFFFGEPGAGKSVLIKDAGLYMAGLLEIFKTLISTRGRGSPSASNR
jgi:hypothetical protein